MVWPFLRCCAWGPHRRKLHQRWPLMHFVAWQPGWGARTIDVAGLRVRVEPKQCGADRPASEGCAEGDRYVVAIVEAPGMAPATLEGSPGVAAYLEVGRLAPNARPSVILISEDGGSAGCVQIDIAAPDGPAYGPSGSAWIDAIMGRSARSTRRDWRGRATLRDAAGPSSRSPTPSSTAGSRAAPGPGIRPASLRSTGAAAPTCRPTRRSRRSTGATWQRPVTLASTRPWKPRVPAPAMWPMRPASALRPRPGASSTPRSAAAASPGVGCLPRHQPHPVDVSEGAGRGAWARRICCAAREGGLEDPAGPQRSLGLILLNPHSEVAPKNGTSRLNPSRKARRGPCRARPS